MTLEQYHLAFDEISNYTDPDAYISDLALSSVFPEDSDLTAIAEDLRCIWTAYHMTVRDLRKAAGLTQADFARRFAIPKRTIENWEAKPGANARECPLYTRLLIADALGLLPEVEM